MHGCLLLLRKGSQFDHSNLIKELAILIGGEMETLGFFAVEMLCLDILSFGNPRKI